MSRRIPDARSLISLAAAAMVAGMPGVETTGGLTQAPAQRIRWGNRQPGPISRRGHHADWNQTPEQGEKHLAAAETKRARKRRQRMQAIIRESLRCSSRSYIGAPMSEESTGRLYDAVRSAIDEFNKAGILPSEWPTVSVRFGGTTIEMGRKVIIEAVADSDLDVLRREREELEQTFRVVYGPDYEAHGTSSSVDVCNDSDP